jgi:hypothetical protein
MASKVQPTIDISSIMMNWILGHMYMIELGLLILVCLSINNANKKWIIVPINNKIAFAMYGTTQFLFIFIFQR